MKTKAAILWQIGEELEVVEVELADLRPTEVVVDVRASGICGSDLAVQSGIQRHTLPAVLGHEGAGIVTHLGEDVRDLCVGDHVVITWAPRCNVCEFCRRGDHRHCARLQPRRAPHITFQGRPVAAGSGVATLAQRTVVPSSGVVRITKDIPLELAAFLGCAVTTGVGAVINTAGVSPESTVLIIGAGAVGMSAVQGARLSGAAGIAVCEPLPHRRAMALREGATWVGSSIDEGVASVTGGFGFDFVLDAVSSAATVRAAWNAARVGGTVVVLGVGRVDELVSFSVAELGKSDKKLCGCVYGSADVQRDIPRLIDAWQRGDLHLDIYPSETFKLEAVNEAFSYMRRGDGLRAVVQMAPP